MAKEAGRCDRDWTLRSGIPTITDKGKWYRIEINLYPDDAREDGAHSSTYLLCIRPDDKTIYCKDIDFAKQLLGGSIHNMITVR